MKTRVSFVLAALASLLFACGFPWLAIQPLILSSSFHTDWVRAAGGTPLLARALAEELLVQVPEEVWSPWVSREPERLRALLGELLDKL